MAEYLCPQQKYPPGCQKGFSHIMRILWVSRLLFSILQVLQVNLRGLSSQKTQKLQLQRITSPEPLCRTFFFISSKSSQDCPACGQEDSCICLSVVRGLLCEIMQASHHGQVRFYVSIELITQRVDSS